MKKIVLRSLVCFALIGCGGGGSGTSGGGTGGGTIFTENNTTIPLTGIYEDSDSEQVKYLKVINYARSIGRECKDNDGLKSDGTPADPSRGSFSAVSPLTINNSLYDAALEHSTDLANSDTFSHDGSGTIHDETGTLLGHKSTYIERIEANGYTEYERIGENIAGGQATIEEAVHAWLESPGHCANIMKSIYEEMGLAKYENAASTYKVYWTNTFGVQ